MSTKEEAKYNCKQCAFGGNTGLEMARHVRAEHKGPPRPYKKRKAKEKPVAPSVDPETKLISDAYALFDASETTIQDRLRVLKYLQDRYTTMLGATEQENGEEVNNA
jgi:hypothetical protein